MVLIPFDRRTVAPPLVNCDFTVGHAVSYRILTSQTDMGVATTTDTTDSVRTSFEVFKNLYGMSVQVDEIAKSKKEGKAAVWEKFVKAAPE